MLGQHGAGGTAGGGGDDGEREIRGRHAHSGGEAGTRAGGDRCLDEQQADGSDLDRDGEPGHETGDEGGGGVHDAIE